MSTALWTLAGAEGALAMGGAVRAAAGHGQGQASCPIGLHSVPADHEVAAGARELDVGCALRARPGGGEGCPGPGWVEPRCTRVTGAPGRQGRRGCTGPLVSTLCTPPAQGLGSFCARQAHAHTCVNTHLRSKLVHTCRPAHMAPSALGCCAPPSLEAGGGRGPHWRGQGV